ncbi:hypothetical protein OF83DRAFT_874566 [Amylostereum chailletii]|nr:hypothetical protein OF83DRAFT_874566 [Amylostereum chailletii]
MSDAAHSSGSSSHSGSRRSFHSNGNDDGAPPSPAPSFSGGSSSSSDVMSLDQADEENATITAHRLPQKKQSIDDLQLLAISTHITELSYSISDIQTRIFEIQELRHKSQSLGDAAGATSVIDQSLMALDERLENVSQGVKTVAESLAPLLETARTPRPEAPADWETVQEESDVLREELKEDKWLTVFRTVTEQADGMMSSLEKAVNRCQDFIWQVHRYGPDESLSPSSSHASMGSTRSEKSPLSLDVWQSLLDSFEAKKKHYMPATTKVLSIIDKGVQDRVTKNGECLRRHAESTQRWKLLRERIARTEGEMESVRKVISGGDITPSESGGSTTSGPTSKSKSRNGYLTPPSGSGSVSGKKSRGISSNSTLSRSISPFRKFARKLTGSSSKSPPVLTPTAQGKQTHAPRTPSSEPVRTVRHRASILGFGAHHPVTPVTPERPGHKYSQSMTPDSSPSTRRFEADQDITIKARGLGKQPWNSSTKVEPGPRLTRRPSTSGGFHSDLPPVPGIPSNGGSPYKRSLSRSSMSSSRPWSPMSSTVSIGLSLSSNTPMHQRSPSRSQGVRPPSRTQYQPARPPSRSQHPPRAPSRSQTPLVSALSPRSRPKTPSCIPSPVTNHFNTISSMSRAPSAAGWDDDDYDAPTSLMQRAFSPSGLPPRAITPGGTLAPLPRPPSRSMIPAPVFQFSSPSRPGSALSDNRSASPTQSTTSSFRLSALRSQTPESALRARAQQGPLSPGHGHGYSQSLSPGTAGYSVKTIRPSLANKMPPSAFREASSPRTPSRSGSRAGAYTPNQDAAPTHLYTPAHTRDPLDTEVAAIVNSVAHGLLVERVDPPLKKAPKEGEEIRAQYAFTNAIARKLVTCRLTTLSRANAKGETSTATKKVMVRVGGGWQDLQLYMLNRQAGM